MGIELRLGQVEDAPACAAIVSDWIARTDWLSGPSSQELNQMIANGMAEREFWVAGDPIEGYLSFNRELAQIMGLYCAAPGSGVGKALMDRVKQGRDYIQLRTHAANRQAHRFYGREGFKLVGGAEPGADGIAEIRMEWHRDTA